MPEHERGKIYSPEAYARGKMLDHSGWCGVLPRNITPSDIDAVMDSTGDCGPVDAVIDNNGRLLFMEFNSSTPYWLDLRAGQRRLYEGAVRAGGGKIVAACCRHATPEDGRHLDSVKDVLEFQFMYLKDGRLAYTRVFPGKAWPQAVRKVLRFEDRS